MKKEDYYNELNKGFAWLLALWLSILLVFCLSGCRTKSVTEYVAVHDTLLMHKTDTLRDVRMVTRTDTLRQVESHVLTVNERGDTIREVHYMKEVEKVVVIDSTNRYQAKVDSLQAIIDKSQEKTTVKEPTWWERWGRDVASACCIAVPVIIFLLYLRLKRLSQ